MTRLKFDLKKGENGESEELYILVELEVKEYKLVGKDTVSSDKFEKQVNHYLKDGWKLHGDAFVYREHICQIMVRY